MNWSRASACLYNPAMTPPYWQQAVAHLSKTDTVMAQLIASYPHASLVSRGDPFLTLVRSVVGQQISVRAADTIWLRLRDTVPDISPTTILAHPAETLRQCGLSARKVEYLSDLARHFGNGQIHTHRWPTMSDAEIIKELTTVRGIGVWTAEMFLIFNQLRPDIFPLDDIGLQKAVAKHYCAGERPGRSQLIGIGERWRPWRSVATWYLWRSLDPVPVEY